MRLIDADAYAKEMRDRQDACEAAINAESYEGETFSLRQHWEGVFAAFVEAKLTLDSMPTVEKQEPVKPEHGFPDLKCPNCGTAFVSEIGYLLGKPIAEYYRHCPGCGREVKWNA